MHEYEPFEYRVTKDNEVLVYRSGTLVTVVRGRSGASLSAKLGHNEAQDQRLLQRATGNYKRGNERNR